MLHCYALICILQVEPQCEDGQKLKNCLRSRSCLIYCTVNKRLSKLAVVMFRLETQAFASDCTSPCTVLASANQTCTLGVCFTSEIRDVQMWSGFGARACTIQADDKSCPQAESRPKCCIGTKRDHSSALSACASLPNHDTGLKTAPCLLQAMYAAG